MFGNAADRLADWTIDRLDHIKARRKENAPPHIRAEVDSMASGESIDSYWGSLTSVQQEKVALYISWIMANVDLIARETTTAELEVWRRKGETKQAIINHDFELLFANPNEHMSRSFLLRFLVHSLYTSDRGAFIFLSPSDHNDNKLMELWPILSHRIEPVKNRGNYVKYFKYTPVKKEKPLLIDAKHVLWVRFPDRFDYWKSAPPIASLIDAMKVAQGISGTQKKLFADNRGIPLTIVGVDPEISPIDYEVVRDTIREDWEDEGSTVSVVQSGQINIESLGMTQKDLEVVASSDMTRDEIDTVFFGWPVRNVDGGDGLREVDRFIREKTVYPLHIMLAEEITLQILKKFYTGKLLAKFDDIRARDRALQVQEKNTISRWKTINEMREMENLQPVDEGKDFKGIGDLLVPLADNPQFVATYFELNPEPEPAPVAGDNIEGPPKSGNMPNTQDSVAATNQLARGDAKPTNEVTNTKAAIEFAIQEELKRWRNVARKDVRKTETRRFSFKTEFVPESIKIGVLMSIGAASTVDMVNAAFNGFIDAA